VYSALKAAVSHFTRCAALELAEHRIRVNAIVAGAIVTADLPQALAVPEGRESEALTCCDRCSPVHFRPVAPASRADIAAAAAYLASDEGSYVPDQDWWSMAGSPQACRSTATPAGNDDRRSSQVETRDLTEPIVAIIDFFDRGWRINRGARRTSRTTAITASTSR